MRHPEVCPYVQHRQSAPKNTTTHRNEQRRAGEGQRINTSKGRMHKENVQRKKDQEHDRNATDTRNASQKHEKETRKEQCGERDRSKQEKKGQKRDRIENETSKHEKSKGKRSGDHDCSFELKNAKVSLLGAEKLEGQWT